MTWLNPAAFVFLGAIPIIIVLHSLRYRRRDVQVSTLFLWEQVMREVHGSLGLRRLIQNLPLLLQILLALLLTLALANPALTKVVLQSKDIVLVLDVSASMQTETSQGTRFALAQQEALKVLQALPSGRQMALIAAAQQPRVVTFFTEEKALLRQAIANLQPTDAPGNMRDAILLALSFTQGHNSQEVVVIGDGAYRQVQEGDFPREQIRHIRVAGGEDNIGITRFAARQVLEPTQRYEVLLAVKNFSSQPRQVPLQLTLRRRHLLERQLSLRPGQEEVIVTSLDGELKGVVQAEIQVDDPLPLDNRAYGVLAAKSQTWVLLVGESNYFLEQLLTSLPGVVVNTAPEVTAEMLPQVLASNHVIVFNGVQPPPLQRGNFLLINTLPQDPRLSATGSVVRPPVLDWDHQHPLLQFVDLTDLRIETALALQPQREAHSLIDGPDMSLLSVIEEPSLRVLTLAFDLMQSDLPLRVAFPVFMSNLLRWLNPSSSDDAVGQVHAGLPYPIFFETPVQHVTVQDPQGKEREYAVQGNPWIFPDAERIGVYIFRYGDAKRYLTVSLLDQDESDVSPAAALPSLSAAAASQHAGVIETPLWSYLLLGGVVILLGEWYVWCLDL